MTVAERLEGHVLRVREETAGMREEHGRLTQRLTDLTENIARAEEAHAELLVALNVVRERDIRVWRDDAGLVNVGVAPHGPDVPDAQL